MSLLVLEIVSLALSIKSSHHILFMGSKDQIKILPLNTVLIPKNHPRKTTWSDYG
jgi:hypothetical protein